MLPTRYREQVTLETQGRLVVTMVDPDECLLVYPLAQWEQVERKLMNPSSQHPLTLGLQRLMLGQAADVELDAHGRFLVPPELRAGVRLERHAMLLGQGRHFELWDEMRWSEWRTQWLKNQKASSELASLLGQLSL